MDFETTYAACFQKVYRFALSMTRNAHEAEEIAQETFFRALAHMDSLPGEAAVDAWLFRIARNLHISRLRKHKREIHDERIEQLPAGTDVEEQLVSGDQATRILRLLHTLDEPYKEVFTLRALGEVPYRQIGMLFDKGEGWARVTYYRARLLLTDMMNREEHI